MVVEIKSLELCLSGGYNIIGSTSSISMQEQALSWHTTSSQCEYYMTTAETGRPVAINTQDTKPSDMTRMDCHGNSHNTMQPKQL